MDASNIQFASNLYGNNSLEKGSSYSWQAELETTRDLQTRNDILERRSAEIRRLYDQTQDLADERCVLEKEWFALVKEKDINFRQQLEEENEEAKRMQMKELFHLLESLRTFSFDKPNEVILKRNLTKMYNQIGRYCQRNKIDLKVEQNNEADKLVNTQTVDSIATPKLVQMPIPPPPPPPPVLTSCTLNVVPQPKVSENEQRRVATKTATFGTPRNHSNEELLRSIRERCRSELKSTPFKRSPGGTPLKRPRRMSETHTSDLIELALKRKFQKVVIRSPKENDSPRSVTSPGNF